MIHPLIWISYLGLSLQNIFIIWGCNEKTSISFSFFSVINVILWYPCVNKLTNVSRSVLDLFKINNNFATTECKNALFLSLSFLAFSVTLNNFLVVRYMIDVLTYSPNISMQSTNYSIISTFIVLYFIFIFIPKKVWLFPLTTDIYPNCFFISFMISNITSGFLWYNLLSSTYQEMLHCVPSINLSATHLS